MKKVYLSSPPSAAAAATFTATEARVWTIHGGSIMLKEFVLRLLLLLHWITIPIQLEWNGGAGEEVGQVQEINSAITNTHTHTLVWI